MKTNQLTTESFVFAIKTLGGEATLDQLKNYFGISNGSQFAGVRRAAVSKKFLKEDGDRLIFLQAPMDVKETKVDHDDIVNALINLGGTSTAREIARYFSLEDGRSLTGGRKVAKEHGLITIEDGIWRLVDKWSDVKKWAAVS